MMPPGGMIISNGMGGFIQYGQTMTPGAMSPAYGVVPQGLGMGQMQMILQPTLSLRHVSKFPSSVVFPIAVSSAQSS
jgi:hypothetical protein